MFYLRQFMNTLLPILAACAITAVPGYAVTAACASTATGTVLDTIDSANSGNNTNNALGCGSVDLSFDNLAFSGTPTASGGYTAPTLTNTALFVSGGTIANNTISQMSMTVNPTSSTLWSSTYSAASPSAGALTFTLNYSVTAQSSGSYGNGGSTTAYTQPDPGFRWYFDKISAGIAGTVTNIPGTTTQSAVVTTTFCLGSTSVVGCSAANSGTLTATIAEGSVISLACSASTTNYTCSSGTVDLINTIRVSTIGFSSVVNLTRANNSNAGTVGLDSFSINFDQVAYAPEPSTFALLGSALIALGCARKRRQAGARPTVRSRPYTPSPLIDQRAQKQKTATKVF